MRYLKILLLAIFIFLCLIFFFQNQAPLSQEMALTLNLFFIPPMTSISLPFYFLLIAAFFVGAVLCWIMLVWDHFNDTAKNMKAKWRIGNLEKQVANLQKIIDSNAEKQAANIAIPAKTGEVYPKEEEAGSAPEHKEEAKA